MTRPAALIPAIACTRRSLLVYVQASRSHAKTTDLEIVATLTGSRC